ncbi:MAG: AarF/ABC1/UbiB kinase family protein [Leptospira sp.]|nr:AarF/ABC1/UbiB kinase family protein [Leptospira sp.]
MILAINYFMAKSNRSDRNTVFTYRNKSHFSRFLIAYFFSVRKSFVLLWHHKFLRHILTRDRFLRREEILYRNLGLECRILFLKLGGVYIKVGQFISNLSHILPDYFIESFNDLQDRIPPHPFAEIKERFLLETKAEIESIFPDIDPTPIASASTAQVHTATINGEKVAIKILYPDIEQLVEKDLETIYFVMKRINRYIVKFDFKPIHREIESLIKREMNLRKEAESITKMAELFIEEQEIIFPLVHGEYSTSGILITQFIEGVKISDSAQVSGKFEHKSKALELLLRAYILMIFKYKFFHADPHSGNLLFTPDGKLCFIDFGCIGEISESTRASLRKVIISSMSRDYYGVIESMEEMGFFSRDADREKLEEIAQFAFEKFERFLSDTEYFRNISIDQLNPEESIQFLKGINSSLSELLKIARIPMNFVALQRILALLVGNIAILDPYHTIFDYADRPFRLIVLGGSSVERILKEEGKDIVGNTLSIPGELHRSLLNINRGRWNIRVRDVDAQTGKFYILGHQFIYTGLFISFIHFAMNFETRGNMIAALTFYVAGGLNAFFLLVSFLRNRSDKRSYK